MASEFDGIEDEEYDELRQYYAENVLVVDAYTFGGIASSNTLVVSVGKDTTFTVNLLDSLLEYRYIPHDESPTGRAMVQLHMFSKHMPLASREEIEEGASLGVRASASAPSLMARARKFLRLDRNDDEEKARLLGTTRTLSKSYSEIPGKDDIVLARSSSEAGTKSTAMCRVPVLETFPCSTDNEAKAIYDFVHCLVRLCFFRRLKKVRARAERRSLKAKSTSDLRSLQKTQSGSQSDLQDLRSLPGLRPRKKEIKIKSKSKSKSKKKGKGKRTERQNQTQSAFVRLSEDVFETPMLHPNNSGAFSDELTIQNSREKTTQSLARAGRSSSFHESFTR